MSQPFAVDLHHPPLVLAGTSLGPESDAVVRTALRLARAGHGRVYLAHALEPPPAPAGAMGFALAPVVIGDRVTLGVGSTVMGDVIVGAGATLLPHSVLLPGARVGEGEVWGGVPARPIPRSEMEIFKEQIRHVRA